MAYTTLTNAQLAVDKPGSSAAAQAFRDNPLAIAAGGAGAPRVAGLGMLPEAASADWSDGGDVDNMVTLDLGEARAAIVMCYVNGDLNENDEAGSTTIKLQGSLNNSTWTDLATIVSNISADDGLEANVSIAYPYVGTGGTAYRYYRLKLDTSGNNTSGNACLMCIGSAET